MWEDTRLDFPGRDPADAEGQTHDTPYVAGSSSNPTSRECSAHFTDFLLRELRKVVWLWETSCIHPSIER